MAFKIKKWNITTIFLFVTVLALQNFAQLIPNSSYIIQGYLKFSDIGLILAVFWTIWIFICTSSKVKIKYTYGIYVIVFFLMVLISSYSAQLFFDQPILTGIRSLRIQIVCFLLYFPITRALQSGVLKRDNLIKILFWVGTFELIVYTLQYFLVGTVSFTYVDLNEIRNNTARLRFPYLLPMILGMFSINDIFNIKGENVGFYIKKSFYIVMSFFLLAIICQHRAPTLILVMTWGFAYLLWKKDVSTKLLVGIVGIVVGLTMLLNLTITYDALYTLGEKSSTTNTLTIRELGQKYYMNRLEESPIVGFGFPNINCTSAVKASGFDYNYFLVDNGIIGFLYIFGWCGVIWLILLYLKSFKMSYYLYKHKKLYMYLLYFIFEIANLYIGLHWFYFYTFPFIFIISILDFDFIKESGENYE